MQPLRRNINPFALMLDPQAVLAQIESSERLDRLQRRICRPLDKPMLGAPDDATDSAGNDLAERVDAAVTAAGDAGEPSA